MALGVEFGGLLGMALGLYSVVIPKVIFLFLKLSLFTLIIASWLCLLLLIAE
jgi:hypothetical protein